MKRCIYKDIDDTKVPFNPVRLDDGADQDMAIAAMSMIIQVMPPTASVYYLSRIMMFKPDAGLMLLRTFYDQMCEFRPRDGPRSTGYQDADELLEELMDRYRSSLRAYSGGYFYKKLFRPYYSEVNAEVFEFMAKVFTRLVNLALETAYLECSLV